MGSTYLGPDFNKQTEKNYKSCHSIGNVVSVRYWMILKITASTLGC